MILNELKKELAETNIPPDEVLNGLSSVAKVCAVAGLLILLCKIGKILTGPEGDRKLDATIKILKELC